MVSCCVPFCKSKHKTGSGISFHDFPVDEEQCRQWLARISRKDWRPNFDNSSGSRVCSLHFKPTDYKEEAKRRLLKPGVVPSIFPHYPKYMQPKERKARSTKAIEKRQKATSVRKGTNAGKMDQHGASLPAKSTFGQNQDEYIVPTTADSSSAASTSSGFPAGASPLLFLSDVRSLAGPSTSRAAQPIIIKEEPPEVSMEEDFVQSTSMSNAVPSTAVTPVYRAARPQQPICSIVGSRVASTVGQVSSSASAPQYVQRMVSSPVTTMASDRSTQPGTYVAVRKRVVPWSAPSERKTRLEEELLVEQKKKLEAELRKLEAEQRRVEAEERKIVTETLLLAAELKKCEDERAKLKAEAEFFVQEKKKSEEGAKKATAIAEFHLAEKRKAETQEQMFAEQKKTEIVRRRMLLMQLKKMRHSTESNHHHPSNDLSG